MSDMYAIKSSTLTTLGDAVRSKVGETRTEYKDIEMITETLTAQNISYGDITNSIYYRNSNMKKVKIILLAEEETSNLSSFQYKYQGLNSSGGTNQFNLVFDETKELITEANGYFDLGASITSLIVGNNYFKSTIGYIPLDENDNPLIVSHEVLNTMTPMEMAEKINGLEAIPSEALNITGDCDFRFSNDGWSWFINFYGNKITTSDITSAKNMFYNASMIETMPFEINFKKGANYHNLSNIFCNASKLKEIPKINNVIPYDIDHIFTGCNNIRYLPEDIGEWFDWSYMEKQTSVYTGSKSYMFQYCFSLRKVPMSLLNRANPNVKYSYSYLYYGFQGCYSLDELVGLPIPYTAAWTSNAFGYSFKECYRLKDMTFAVQEDGTPHSVNWKSQTIDLSDTGFVSSNKNRILNYNSGITADKEVVDDATYQALKDDPDWFTSNAAYSRYNHDSAVNTINSLPIITATGTNTIKFKGAAGSLTDGGAINTLTEEEIAVAAAKGWTVSLA